MKPQHVGERERRSADEGVGDDEEEDEQAVVPPHHRAASRSATAAATAAWKSVMKRSRENRSACARIAAGSNRAERDASQPVREGLGRRVADEHAR